MKISNFEFMKQFSKTLMAIAALAIAAAAHAQDTNAAKPAAGDDAPKISAAAI